MTRGGSYARYAATGSILGLVAGSLLSLAPASASAAATLTFTATQSTVTYTVPAGIYSVAIQAIGGSGASGQGGGSVGAGGAGADVAATVPVQPGETLSVTVGGNGNAAAGGYNGGGQGGAAGSSHDGGGGGGATVVQGTNDVYLVVAGGGGGGGGNGQYQATAGAGGSSGQSGTSGGTGNGGAGYVTPTGGGGGAITTANGPGGAGSTFSNSAFSGCVTGGSAGSPGSGPSYSVGPASYGGSGGQEYAGAGGGGGGGAGYYAGGGGGGGASEFCSTTPSDSAGGGGGGGSSYAAPFATSVSYSTAAFGAAPMVSITPLMSVTTQTLPGGVVGQTYSTTLQASGGTSPYTWAITSGSLPQGLNLNTTTGAISGTPTAAGTSSFQVTATDATNATATANVSITVTQPLLVTTSSLPAGVVGESYSQSLLASGGTTPYTWNLTSGTLPAGLTLVGNTISGTPSAAGSATLGFSVTDSSNPTQSASATLVLAVQPPLAVGTSSLAMTVGRKDEAQLVAANGTGPYTWSILSGTLPSGLTMNSQGLISGTPTTLGQTTVMVQVQDRSTPQQTASANVTVNVTQVPMPEVTGVSPATGTPSGGTSVTITGQNFLGAEFVYFGTALATNFLVKSSTEIVVTAPSGSGTVDVRVGTQGGTSAVTSADQFAYALPKQYFSDVPAGYWAAAAIDELAQDGIVNGFPDGTFRPDLNVTRAQFVKMLVNTLGLKPSGASTGYTDVPASAWYAPYVSAAVQAGILSAPAGSTFDANAPVSRQDVAAMVASGLQLTKTTALTFSDASQISSADVTGVEETVAAGIMQGFPDGTFRPLSILTRAQAAQVLAGVLAYKK